MSRVFLIIVLTLFAVEVYSNATDFHRVEAQSGDGVYAILRRYHLLEHQCNLSQFYKLNDLVESSAIHKGKKYYIPVVLYKYDKKSIRSTIGINDWDKAKRIQKYNQLILNDKLRKKTYQTSKILWVPFHELGCESPLPEAKEIIKEEPLVVEKPIEKAHSYEIFGEKYAYVPLKDNRLSGKVFYIVSGHGGPDPGAIGKKKQHNLCEDEYAYDVALRLTRNLIEHGATAYMITRDPDDGIRSGDYLACDTDEYVWGGDRMPRNQKKRLFQRSNAINKLYRKHKKEGVKDQKMLEIHVDSRSKSSQTDVFFYYFPGSRSGKRLAKKMQKTFALKYKKYRSNGQYHGTVTGRDLHMLRETKPTSAYIEIGNIRNNFDQKRFLLESNRQALANWLLESLIN